MNTSEIERRFEEYRDHLRSEIGRLGDYIALYRRLHERRADHVAEINFAPAFFSVVTDALFSAIVLWVDKLCDEKGQRGIFDFLAFIEHNLSMFAIEQLKRRRNYQEGHWMLDRDEITIKNIGADRERIRNLDCLKSFEIRRDKFHAHFDKDYFFDRERLTDEAPITWGDSEKVVKVLSDVMNYYSAAYDGNYFELTSSNINDLDYILSTLRKYQEYVEEEYKRQEPFE